MFKKKSIALLVSLILVLCATVGGTLAFLIDISRPVENTFTPSEVTTEVDEDIKTDPTTKKNVRIKNTGDTTAWIRAYYIITWQNSTGEVYGTAPKAGEDYTISLNESDWLVGNDGFYYWPDPVKSDDQDAKNCYTGILINSIAPVAGKAPDGYTLHVEIIGSGVQYEPEAAFNAWAPESGITYGKTALSKG